MSATNQRVFLMDGQAVYLEGDGEITEEVLQQALSQLARQGQTIEEADPASLQVAAGTHAPADIQTLEVQEGEGEATLALTEAAVGAAGAGEEDGSEEGVLAVLQDENGHQQTVRLTPDQAAALGINYDELLAAASMAASQGEEDGSVEDGTVAMVTADGSETAVVSEHSDVQQQVQSQVDALTSSVILDLNADKTGLVGHDSDPDKVTYTFEVVDDKGASEAPATAGVVTEAQSQLLGGKQRLTSQLQQQQQQGAAVRSTVVNNNNNNSTTGVRRMVTSAQQGYRPGGSTPRAAYPAESATTPFRTLKTAVTPSIPSKVVKKPGVVAASGGSGDAPASGDTAGTGEEDLPVILTPMCGQSLPDFIEPRPGLKILVRPLEEQGAGGANGAAGGQRPLGSSDNPIQLVQQGNTFKSLQPLNANQLKQIATVLQQSRLNIPANTKNTIYDSDTKTRIVYRVVYPDESGRQKPGRGRGRGRGAARQSRAVAQLDAIDQADEDWSPSLEMNRDSKKKATTKTRTGRLSKPPKYMVKDYRHIHRTDLNGPDLDDSDGGYSEWDYDELDGDNDKPASKITYDDEVSLDGDSKPARAKRPIAQSMRDRFGCRTCGALCIGYMRLEGHFRKNPTHERPPYIPTKAEALAAAKKRPGKVGRPPGPSKRPRLDDEGDAGAEWGPEDVFSVMVELAEGSVDKLFDMVCSCSRLFRQYASRRLLSVTQPGILAVNNSSVQTVHVNAERAAVSGLSEGVYAVDTAEQDVEYNGVSESTTDGATGLHIASVTSESVLTPSSATSAALSSDPASQQPVLNGAGELALPGAPGPASVDPGTSGPGVAESLDEFVDDLVNSSDYHFHSSTTTAPSVVAAVTTSSQSLAKTTAVTCDGVEEALASLMAPQAACDSDSAVVTVTPGDSTSAATTVTAAGDVDMNDVLSDASLLTSSAAEASCSAVDTQTATVTGTNVDQCHDAVISDSMPVLH